MQNESPTFQRKEVIGGCTLYLGDSIELPTLELANALITDSTIQSR